MTRLLKLGKQPGKINRDLTLLQNEKCLITAQQGTLTIPIINKGNTQGHLLTGKAQLTLDAIIDTPRGAIGRSLTSDLTQPFLMFSIDNKISEDLAPATDQDMTNAGYENLEDLLVKANDIFSQFIINSRKHPRLEENTEMFAFFTEDKTWDILIAKEDKLIFTSKSQVYIFRDAAEDIEFQPQRLVLAEDGKTVIIGKNNILIDFAHQRFI